MADVAVGPTVDVVVLVVVALRVGSTDAFFTLLNRWWFLSPKGCVSWLEVAAEADLIVFSPKIR